MKGCTRCRKILKKDYKMCPYCGGAPQNVCMLCRKALPEGGNICESCDTKIKNTRTGIARGAAFLAKGVVKLAEGGAKAGARAYGYVSQNPGKLGRVVKALPQVYSELTGTTSAEEDEESEK